MSRNKLAGIIIACTIAIIMVIVLVILPLLKTPMHTLSVSVSPSGLVSVSPSGGEYESGMKVTLFARPTSGYQFVNWTGDIGTVADITSASTTITMNGHYSITANFVLAYHSIQECLVAANTELESVKTGLLAFHYDKGYWPETSDELGDDYVFIELLRARYHFCATSGWVIGADFEGVDDPWLDMVAFKPGACVENGYHGEWVTAE